MGDSKRRKERDRNYRQLTPEDQELIKFFGEDWYRHRSPLSRRQAYLDMQLLLKTLSPEELEEVTTEWENQSPRPPLYNVIMTYIHTCGYNPLIQKEVDEQGRIIDVLRLH